MQAKRRETKSYRKFNSQACWVTLRLIMKTETE
jgi:hypothetical protein